MKTLLVVVPLIVVALAALRGPVIAPSRVARPEAVRIAVPEAVVEPRVETAVKTELVRPPPPPPPRRGLFQR